MRGLGERAGPRGGSGGLAAARGNGWHGHPLVHVQHHGKDVRGSLPDGHCYSALTLSSLRTTSPLPRLECLTCRVWKTSSLMQ